MGPQHASKTVHTAESHQSPSLYVLDVPGVCDKRTSPCVGYMMLVSFSPLYSQLSILYN